MNLLQQDMKKKKKTHHGKDALDYMCTEKPSVQSDEGLCFPVTESAEFAVYSDVKQSP